MSDLDSLKLLGAGFLTLHALFLGREAWTGPAWVKEGIPGGLWLVSLWRSRAVASWISPGCCTGSCCQDHVLQSFGSSSALCIRVRVCSSCSPVLALTGPCPKLRCWVPNSPNPQTFFGSRVLVTSGRQFWCQRVPGSRFCFTLFPFFAVNKNLEEPEAP